MPAPTACGLSWSAAPARLTSSMRCWTPTATPTPREHAGCVCVCVWLCMCVAGYVCGWVWLGEMLGNRKHYGFKPS